mgnify:CR=1 FL=1
MNANIDKRTTARTFLVGKPQANSSGNSARPDPAGTRAINFAQAPFGDDVPGGANSGVNRKLAPKEVNQSPFSASSRSTFISAAFIVGGLRKKTCLPASRAAREAGKCKSSANKLWRRQIAIA